MRLINTTTYEFSEFHGGDIPEYAILSHTWENEEVTFQEWAFSRRKAEKKAGYAKIEATCKLASEIGLRYAWVDTCCIDKSSSAELSEAINSMFAWYAGAVVCFAFLADVVEGEVEKVGSQLGKELREGLSKSRWFTRGWTLQELLAPSKIVFYSRNWVRLGDKSNTLTQVISHITGISASYLLGYSPITAASVALRMFWVSRRKTTRVEDMAYCMLGIFDINMPLLYGEGTKAFVRLQEEIIKVSDDHTIFCWTWTSTVSPAWMNLIAPSPDTFQGSRYFIPASTFGQVSPYSMTNAGLSISLPVIQAWSYNFVVLKVNHPHRATQWRACIPVRSILHPSISGFLGTYRRISYPPDPLFMPIDWASTEMNMFIKSRMMPMFHQIPPLQRFTEPRCVLVTLGEGLSSRRSIPIPIQINSDTRIATKPKKIMSLSQPETYPPELFDETGSVFRLNHRTVDSWSGLLALSNKESGCVIFISCKIDIASRKRWLCHILPAGSWPDGEVERQKLLGLLASQVASMKGDSEIRAAISTEIGGYFVIDGGGGRNGDGNDIDEEDERSIVTARLDLGLGKEKIMEISKRIEESLHI
ncbi:hypothetical protein BPAE_0116g00120 [Botrytis paeoniae]|uniref:Heterokaryon incompatibility domain-containing protein n=1 Tax=Botrytis paeoniae TaxID=278948 RepID=A0A4Z1FQQ0_9HELO|nr:hypothetical protein BPAE_0116g00120 [Botrytis paeoniae]